MSQRTQNRTLQEQNEDLSIERLGKVYEHVIRIQRVQYYICAPVLDIKGKLSRRKKFLVLKCVHLLKIVVDIYYKSVI